ATTLKWKLAKGPAWATVTEGTLRLSPQRSDGGPHSLLLTAQASNTLKRSVQIKILVVATPEWKQSRYRLDNLPTGGTLDFSLLDQIDHPATDGMRFSESGLPSWLQ